MRLYAILDTVGSAKRCENILGRSVVLGTVDTVRYSSICVCLYREDSCTSVPALFHKLYSVPTFVQELDLPVEQPSLLDRSCRATKNRTHVVFRTALDQCQTRKITVDDEDVYSNAVSDIGG